MRNQELIVVTILGKLNLYNKNVLSNIKFLNGEKKKKKTKRSPIVGLFLSYQLFSTLKL